MAAERRPGRIAYLPRLAPGQGMVPGCLSLWRNGLGGEASSVLQFQEAIQTIN